MKITAADLAEFRTKNQAFCAKGCRAWAAAHGFDWADFVENGVTAERLLSTGDALALEIVDWKRKKTGD